MTDPNELVRAESKATGHHVTVRRHVARGDAYRIISNPSPSDTALDDHGHPRRPKFATAKTKTVTEPAQTPAQTQAAKAVKVQED